MELSDSNEEALKFGDPQEVLNLPLFLEADDVDEEILATVSPTISPIPSSKWVCSISAAGPSDVVASSSSSKRRRASSTHRQLATQIQSHEDAGDDNIIEIAGTSRISDRSTTPTLMSTPTASNVKSPQLHLWATEDPWGLEQKVSLNFRKVEQEQEQEQE